MRALTYVRSTALAGEPFAELHLVGVHELPSLLALCIVDLDETSKAVVLG